MSAFRQRGRKVWETQVPLRDGSWAKHTCETRDRVTAREIDEMLYQLGPKKKQAWDLLEMVTTRPQRWSLADLWRRWSSVPARLDESTGDPIEPSVDERIRALRDQLTSVDLEPLVDKWHAALTGPAYAVSEDTADHYLAAVRLLIPAGVPFARELLTEQRIREWLEEMDDVTSATARKRAIGMHQFILYARQHKKLGYDPMRDLVLPPAGEPLCHYLETADIELLAGAATGQVRHLELILPGTAMEVSTALAVRVRAVSKLDKEIHAPGTKSYNRDRIVRVSDFAWNAVLELLKGKHPDSLLFDRIPHRFFARDEHSTARDALVEKGHRVYAEMTGGVAHDYTLRDHRHTWAVRAVRSGTPLEAIARVLGHSNAVLAAKVYARFVPNKEERDRWERQAQRRDARIRKIEGGQS